MAKRKRLTPPSPENLFADGGGEQTPELETKGMFPSNPLGVAPKMRTSAPPIAHVASDAATSAALAEVTAELQAARSEGRMVQSIKLDQIDPNHTVRDRIAVDDEDMASLRVSLQTRGQQTPIEVVEIGQRRYGLISGWRRMTALSQLFSETGEVKFNVALALVRQPQDASDAYVAMVEENEIRVGLSYFERARIVSRAVEEGVYETHKEALNKLFGSASRTKRSKIKSFLPLVEELGCVLRFPAAIGERLGLALSQRLVNEPDFSAIIKAKLKGKPESAEEESDILSVELQVTPLTSPVKGGAKRVKGALETRENIAAGLWFERSKKGLLIGGSSLTADLEARVLEALKS